jgi:SWI/SNF-related matrix-associated actin-dependent regulator 1 of chromatin subfamily A
MSYELALHTRKVASRCIFCHRALVDADSVQAGAGPDCRAKYGYYKPAGTPDDDMILAGLLGAPDVMHDQISPLFKARDYKAMAQKAIWHGALAAEHGGPGANDAIAAAHTIAKGAGYTKVAERIMEMERSRGIQIVREAPGSLAIFAPVSDAWLTEVRKIPGRRFVRAPQPRNVIPESSLRQAMAALSMVYPGQLMVGPEGNMFKVPDHPPQELPAMNAPPAGAPTSATNETYPAAPAALADLVIGERVQDSQGRERIVGWIGPKSSDGYYRIGIDWPGRPVRSGRDFVSFREVKAMPKAVADAPIVQQAKAVAADALQMGAPVPAPPVLRADRQIPAQAMPHQVEGIRWLDAHPGALLADQPGTGKTLVCVCAIDAPAIVICPAVMRAEWADEINRWRPGLTARVISGEKAGPITDYTTADVIVINYDVMSAHEDRLMEAHQQRPFKTLVADEAHALKTLKLKKSKTGLEYSGSARAKSVARLCAVIPRKFMVSATPVLNRPIELFPLLHMIDPATWSDYAAFGIRYCAGTLEEIRVRGGFRRKTWNFEGSSNERELNALLNSRYMLRRDKSMLNLPEKTRETLKVVLGRDEAQEYIRAAEEFLRWVMDNGGPEKVARAKRAEQLAKMTALRGLAAKGKVPAAFDWIVNHKASTGRPLVVMAHHSEVLSRLDTMLTAQGFRIGKIIGGQDERERKRDKEAFQAGKLDVLLCSILAAGVGLTLTRATETLFVERTWRPMDLVQAEDRIHRLGQTNKCTITYLDAVGTIDEAIASLLVRKTQTIAGVIDGEALDEQQAGRRVFGTMFRRGNQPIAVSDDGDDDAFEFAPNQGGQVEIAWNWLDPTDAA